MVPDARPAGRWEPAELGVHPVAGGGPRDPMPAYIGRPHDELLWRMLDPGVPGSRLIVVRGEACAGKSRAAREAVAGRLADWPLEYPPTAAALAARLAAGIPARTVLWLGDLCRYADADDGAAALNRLAELLHRDGPLVITTVWPEHWRAYVSAVGAKRGAGDPARAAGRLIAGLDELASVGEPDPAYGGVIDVPPRFTADELTAAAVRGDPVLAAAAAAAGPAGRVAQHLAGAPGLLRRYDDPAGNPYGQAIITAAMDAARLGCAAPLPAALLRDAAIGYVPAAHPPHSPANALAWASAALDGGIRALEPAPSAADAGPGGYRIAGYLDQHGRRTRRDKLGPASLWDALAGHAHAHAHAGAGARAGAGLTAGDLTRVGQAARDRGLYRHAAALWTAAVSAGSADAAGRLVAHLREVSPEDAGPAARWAVGRVRLHDPWDLARLLGELRASGAGEAIQALLDRDPASQVSVDRQWDAADLLQELHGAGAAGAVDILAARVVEHASLEHLPSVASLLRALHAAGAADAIRSLVARDPARHAHPGEPDDIAVLLEALHAAGAREAVLAVAGWAATDADLDGPQKLARLLTALRAVGARDALRILLTRDPIGHGSFQDPWEAAALLAELRAAGAGDEVQALLDRDPARLGGVEHADSVAWLLAELRAAGAGEAIRTLLARDPARQVDLYDLQSVGQLAAQLAAAGDGQAVRTLAARVAALGADLDDPEFLAERLAELREAGAAEAIPILLAGDPVARVRLDDSANVAWLLEELCAADAGDAVLTLLDRDPAGQASLDHPRDIALLLRALHAAGAGDAVRSLAARAAESTPLEDPQGAAQLLGALRAADAADAVLALLARDPAGQASLDPNPAGQRGAARLLTALRAAGAGQAAQSLAARAADAGMFHLEEIRAGNRSGREPDGTARPWRWAPPLPDR